MNNKVNRMRFRHLAVGVVGVSIRLAVATANTKIAPARINLEVVK